MMIREEDRPKEDRVPANPYEVNRSKFNLVNARARKQATTKNKNRVVQKSLFGADLTVAEAEAAHKAHLRYMADAAREKL